MGSLLLYYPIGYDFIQFLFPPPIRMAKASAGRKGRSITHRR